MSEEHVMPKLCTVAPTFPVADVDATVRWYETVLGFAGYPFPEHPPYVFARVVRDEIEIMFQRIDGYEKPDLITSGASAFGMLTFAWKASRNSMKRSKTRLKSSCRCGSRVMAIGSSKLRIPTATFWCLAN